MAACAVGRARATVLQAPLHAAEKAESLRAATCPLGHATRIYADRGVLVQGTRAVDGVVGAQASAMGGRDNFLGPACLKGEVPLINWST